MLPAERLTGTAATASIHGVPPPITRPSSEAERRQLTVLFCDLVDSTRLAW
jgi:class 3 adenylate cyclase